MKTFFDFVKYFLIAPFLFTGCAIAQTFTLPHDHSDIARGGDLAPSSIDLSNMLEIDFRDMAEGSVYFSTNTYGQGFIVDSAGDGSEAEFISLQSGPVQLQITDGTDTNVLNEESITITNGTDSRSIAADVRGAGTPSLRLDSDNGTDFSTYQTTSLAMVDADFQRLFLGVGSLYWWIAGGKEIIRLDAEANSPGIKMVEHDAATNSQIWNMRATSGSFILTAENDAESSEVTAISVARSGTNIDSILLRSDSLSISNGTDNFQIDGGWYDTGSYSTTTLGCGTEVNVDVYYEKIGNIVHIDLEPQGSTCASDATNFLIAGTSTPSNILPTEETPRVPVGPLVDNSATVFGAHATFNNSGQITFYNASLLTASWTASGSKGFTASDYRAGISFSYRIN